MLDRIKRGSTQHSTGLKLPTWAVVITGCAQGFRHYGLFWEQSETGGSAVPHNTLGAMHHPWSSVKPESDPPGDKPPPPKCDT